MLGFDALGHRGIGQLPSSGSSIVSLSAIIGAQSRLSSGTLFSAIMASRVKASATAREQGTFNGVLSTRLSVAVKVRDGQTLTTAMSSRVTAQTKIPDTLSASANLTARVKAQSSVREPLSGLASVSTKINAAVHAKLPGGFALKTIIKGQASLNESPGFLLQARIGSVSSIQPDIHVQAIVFGPRRALLLSSASPVTATYWKGS